MLDSYLGKVLVIEKFMLSFFVNGKEELVYWYND